MPCSRYCSGTPIAVKVASWSTSFHITWRTAGLSNGGAAWFRRKLPWNWWMPPSPISLTPLLLLEQRQHVERQVLHVVDLARHQRVGAGRLVGHDPQHELVDLDTLAAGQEVRRLGARHVVGIALQHHRVAGPPLVLEETNGPEPTIRRCAGRPARGDPLRHHERQRRVGLAEHLEHQRKRLLQGEVEGLGVVGVERAVSAISILPQRVRAPPALAARPRSPPR